MTEPYNQPLGGNEMPRFHGPASMMRLPTPPSADGRLPGVAYGN